MHCCVEAYGYIDVICVLGKPSKPKGPLEVSDVNAEGCKLKWDKPEDDGGSPIKEYVVEKMDTDTGRWIPVTTTREPAAEITGLIPGKEYKFRVKAVNPEGESDPLETSTGTVAKNPFGIHRIYKLFSHSSGWEKSS